MVHARERVFANERGGSAELPIEVASSAVIELRARATPCPQCGGVLAIEDHRAPSATDRELAMRCVQCGVRRTLHFRLVPNAN
jgi:hypothetical protein